jgi:hypothetical protein
VVSFMSGFLSVRSAEAITQARGRSWVRLRQQERAAESRRHGTDRQRQ